jgi:hypothetical protein
MSTLPQTLISPWRGNPYAPIWAGVTPVIPGYCDVEFDCDPMTVTIAAGQFSYKNQILIDDDADYLAREIFAMPIAGSTPGVSDTINPQDLKIRIVDGDGNFITSDWVTANDLCMPVGPSCLPLRKGCIVYVDLWNQGDATLIVQMGFKGFKRFPCNNEQGPIPKFRVLSDLYCKQWAGARFEEYEFFFEFSNGASAFFPPWSKNLQPITPNGIFRQIPLSIDNDADFLLRGVTGMFMSTDGPTNVLEQFFLRFYNPVIVAMANEVPRLGSVPTPAGPGAEIVLSNGGGRMVPVFPEILIPRGSNFNVDIALQATDTVQFSLRGLKVYQGEVCAN